MNVKEKNLVKKVTNMLSNIKQDDAEFQTKMIDCQEVLYWLQVKGEEVAQFELDKVISQKRWKA